MEKLPQMTKDQLSEKIKDGRYMLFFSAPGALIAPLSSPQCRQLKLNIPTLNSWPLTVMKTLICR